MAPARLATTSSTAGRQDGSAEHDDGWLELLYGNADEEVGNSPDEAHGGEQHPAPFRHPLILGQSRVSMQSQFVIESSRRCLIRDI